MVKMVLLEECFLSGDDDEFLGSMDTPFPSI